MNYQTFLKQKDHSDECFGFSPVWMPDFLFPFQKMLVEWSLKKGRAALLEDCGLGKGPQQLVWCENVVRKTNKSVLILTPLAVSPQMVSEGKKFGIEVHQTQNGKIKKGINVTNYERLAKFNPEDFSAVSCDESSCIKHQDSKRRKDITAFLRKVKYRLLCTATPAPNDYMELGTSSEALGNMGRGQMLGMFFTNGGETTQQWELKGHARKAFWRWVCTWARACRKPSDLGFDDKGFILPELTIKQHLVKKRVEEDGWFSFPHEAVTLEEQRAERKATIRERCEKVAEIIAERKDYAVVWCHQNPEGDLLERMIPGSVQVAGKNTDREKEERLAAFSAGQIKVLITKPKIGGFGLNWQHCNRMTTFPSHSFEMQYQSIRRCWRFGQKRPVTIDIITSEGERRVLNNMLRKEKNAGEMYDGLVREMSEFQLGKKKEEYTQEMKLPLFMKSPRTAIETRTSTNGTK